MSRTELCTQPSSSKGDTGAFARPVEGGTMEVACADWVALHRTTWDLALRGSVPCCCGCRGFDRRPLLAALRLPRSAGVLPRLYLVLLCPTAPPTVTAVPAIAAAAILAVRERSKAPSRCRSGTCSPRSRERVIPRDPDSPAGPAHPSQSGGNALGPPGVNRVDEPASHHCSRQPGVACAGHGRFGGRSRRPSARWRGRRATCPLAAALPGPPSCCAASNGGRRRRAPASS
eukprot:scaffold2188_cov388-Prasinococcus_capsulatus_cf.AAC.9